MTGCVDLLTPSYHGVSPSYSALFSLTHPTTHFCSAHRVAPKRHTFIYSFPLLAPSPSLSESFPLIIVLRFDTLCCVPDGNNPRPTTTAAEGAHRLLRGMKRKNNNQEKRGELNANVAKHTNVKWRARWGREGETLLSFVSYI